MKAINYLQTLTVLQQLERITCALFGLLDVDVTFMTC